MSERRAAFFAGVLVLLGAAPAASAQTDVRIDSVTVAQTQYLLTEDMSVDLVVDAPNAMAPVQVPVQLYLSTDSMLDGGDLPLPAAAISVTSQTSTATLEFAVPVEPGIWFVLAELDPNDTLSDPDRSNNLAADFRVTTIGGADFTVFRVVALPQAFVGRELLYVVDVRNDGPSDWMGGAEVSIRLRPNPISGAPPLDIRTEMTGPMASGTQVSYEGSTLVPTDFALGPGSLEAIVIPSNPRADPDGGASGTTPIDIFFDAPDLQGTIVTTTVSVEAGQSLFVSSRIENLGLADAAETEVAYVLSEDDIIEAGDLEIGRHPVQALDTSFIDVRVDENTVPLTVTPGRYRLGMVIDPDDAIDEIDEDNNGVAGDAVDVFPPDLQIVTSSLTPARRGVAYEAGLVAVGGPVPNYDFALVEGSLPDGISLQESTGILSGIPRALGPFEFTVEVTSGTATGRRPLSLVVVDPTVALSVSVTDLGARLAGRPFLVPMVATGGVPPYAWEALEGLPAGTLLTEDGAWSGAVAEPGAVEFRLRVTDQLEDQAEARITARFVDAADAVALAAGPLPPAVVGRPYCQGETVRLQAMGAHPPFRFTSASPPPGLTLASDGALCGTPTEVGEFSFGVNVSDDLGLVDSAVFMLRVEGDASVELVVEDLPSATLGRFYERAFTARGGMEPYAFSLFTGDLPVGMEVTAEGRIRGTPGEAGLFPFAVEVRDARGVIDRAPFSLRVVASQEEGDEGCTCRTGVRSPGGPGGLLLLAVALSWLRRRRR